MPKSNNTLTKNLHLLCFSLLKRPQPHHNTNPTPLSPSQPPTTTTSYNTLFEPGPGPSSYFSAPSSSTAMSSVSEDDDDPMEEGPTTPDLAAAYASRRFFITYPGRSNSIVDSLSSLSEDELIIKEDVAVAVAGGVPVETDSPDPYVDFRRSMQEMVESRDLREVEAKEAWDYLQELLLSYLSLNPQSTHKYIVGAFADLVVSLLSPTNHTLNHPNIIINHSINHSINHDINNSTTSPSCSSSSSSRSD